MPPRPSTRAGGAICVQLITSPSYGTKDGTGDGTEMRTAERYAEAMRKRDGKTGRENGEMPERKIVACFRRPSNPVLCSFCAFAGNRIYRLL